MNSTRKSASRSTSTTASGSRSRLARAWDDLRYAQQRQLEISRPWMSASKHR